jgi:DNA-binding response OmpR family regulator
MGERKILIIEDDEDIVNAMRIVLEAHGFQVSWAENGKLGLKMVKREKPDLIILDVMMESQTAGFQIAYTLRSNDPKSEYAPFKDVPILMVTGIHDTTQARFNDAVATEWLPVDEFIEKPIQPNQLLSLVSRMIR